MCIDVLHVHTTIQVLRIAPRAQGRAVAADPGDSSHLGPLHLRDWCDGEGSFWEEVWFLVNICSR